MKNFGSISLSIKLPVVSRAIIAFIILASSSWLFAQDDIPSPPSGYDSYKANVPHGKTEVVPYYSSTVGIDRYTRIYLPPGYTTDSTYNVLYLLHGIGGDINEWYNLGSPNYILDNLLAKGKIAPMIVVLPNGRAMVDDSPGSDIYAADKVAGFANFEFELIKDLVPFIDSAYPVIKDREARAIAGLSMGGGQALDFGLAHLDTFAYVGAFSPAPNTKPADSLFPNLEEDTAKISELWISVGGADGLLFVSQNTHNFLLQHNIKHDYLVEPGKGHDWSVWKPGLYHFSQRIFGKTEEYDTTAVNNDDNNNGTSIIRDHDSSRLSLSYNPSDRTITLEEGLDVKKLILYDLNGREVLAAENIDRNTMNIGQLSKGIYVVAVYDGIRYLHGKIGIF